MVFLSITPPIVQALEKLRSFQETTTLEICDARDKDEKTSHVPQSTKSNAKGPEDVGFTTGTIAQTVDTGEPDLSNARIGNPISHHQIIEIARRMRTRGLQPHTLEMLLKGAKVYIAPPTVKPEPTSEYKALMARLLREEEARSYERMTNPIPPMETFAQRFPASSAAHAFSSSHQNINTSDPDDDGLTFADVDRQMALILNVLLSIIACAGAIWIAARWWSTPARLALSMTGSVLVGVAEVVVYSGYIRRVGEAKSKEKSVKEIQEVMNTWVVGAGQDDEDQTDKMVMIESQEDDEELKIRKRLKRPT